MIGAALAFCGAGATTFAALSLLESTTFGTRELAVAVLAAIVWSGIGSYVQYVLESR